MKQIEGAVRGWSWLLLGLIAACGARGGDVVAADGGGAAGAGAATQSLWCDVKHTLDSRCTACHNEAKAAGAPMSLATYADLQAPSATDPSKKVYELVRARVHDPAAPMPPQQPLTGEQLRAIDAWVAAGAPVGSDAACGGTTEVEDDWPTHCDARYTLLAHGPGGDDEPYVVPAGQELHPQIPITAPWGDEALQGIAFRPITDNREVLHHWILYGPKGEFLVGWAPGKGGVPLPPDVGMNLAGGQLKLDMHYNNLLGTQPEQDHSGVEICALKRENFRTYTAGVHMGFTQLGINIPAHASSFDVTGQCTVTSSGTVTLITVSPHAHTLARRMKFSVQKASGETIVLHDAPFDFYEQGAYALETPVELVTGDKVITTCTYDNPTDRAVRFGEDTGDEMCFNFAVYYPMGKLRCGLLSGGLTF